MIKILFVSIGGPPKTNAESIQVSHVMNALIQREDVEITWLTEKVETRSKGWQMVSETYSGLTDRINIIELRNSSDLIQRIKRRIYKTESFPDEKAYVIKKLNKGLLNSLRGVGFDVIYSRSSPMTSHALAMQIKSHLRLPWFAHFSDPWAWSPLIKQDNKKIEFEKNLLSHMDIVYLTNENALKFMKTIYPEKEFHLFRNVFAHLKPLRSNNNTKFKIIHAGNFYQSRTPEPILKSIASLDDDLRSMISLHFVGFMDSENEKLIKEFNTQFEIVTHGGLPYEKALEVQLNADLLVSIDPLLDSKDAIFLPSKIVEYMTMRIPILAFCRPNSPSYKLISNKYGVVFDFNEHQNASLAIGNLIKLWKKDKVYQLKEPDMDYHAKRQVDKLIDDIKAIN